MFKKFRKNKKGFTLIELVVVIGILGVLALLVVPSVVNRIDEAEEAVDRANLKMIQKAIEMYYIENGNYPDATDFDGLESFLVPKYLDEWPELKSINVTSVTYNKTTGKLSYPGLNQQQTSNNSNS